MYQFVFGNFSDIRHALEGVEDCLKRGLTTNDFQVFVSQEGDAWFSATEAPAKPAAEEEAEGAEEEGPAFDPVQYLYYKKLKSLVPVTVVDLAKGVEGSDELKHVLDGASNYLKMGRLLVVVNQPIAQLS